MNESTVDGQGTVTKRPTNGKARIDMVLEVRDKDGILKSQHTLAAEVGHDPELQKRINGES